MKLISTMPTPQNFLRHCCLASLTLTLAGTASAKSFYDPVRVLHLSPLYGYRWGGTFKSADGSTKLDSSPAYGFMLEHNPRGGMQKLQAGWTRQDSQLKLPNAALNARRQVTIDNFHIGMQVEMPHSEKLFGTTTATIGATHFSVEDAGNDTHFFGSLGVGFKYFPGKQDRIALRGDLRGYATFIFTDPPPKPEPQINNNSADLYLDNVFWQLEAMLGLTITF